MGKITRRGSLALTAALAVVLAGTTGASAASSVDRVSGNDRFGTAIDASSKLFPSGQAPAYIVLAQSDDFPDALAAAPLADALGNAPILITPSGADVRDDVLKEIERLGALTGGAATKVVIVGGENAVSAKAEETLKTKLGKGDVIRVAGADRYATAIEIADVITSGDVDGDGAKEGNVTARAGASIFLTTGLKAPDALAAGAAAAKENGVIVLSKGENFDSYTESKLGKSEERSYTRDYLVENGKQTSPRTVYAVGGPAVTAAGSAVTAKNAIKGKDRYETATAVAGRFFSYPAQIGFANGAKDDAPDALVAGAYLADSDSPLLLVNGGDKLPAATASYLSSDKVRADVAGIIFGGPSAVSVTTANAIAGKSGFTAEVKKTVLTVTADAGSGVLVTGTVGTKDGQTVAYGTTDGVGVYSFDVLNKVADDSSLDIKVTLPSGVVVTKTVTVADVNSPSIAVDGTNATVTKTAAGNYTVKRTDVNATIDWNFGEALPNVKVTGPKTATNTTGVYADGSTQSAIVKDSLDALPDGEYTVVATDNAGNKTTIKFVLS